MPLAWQSTAHVTVCKVPPRQLSCLRNQGGDSLASQAMHAEPGVGVAGPEIISELPCFEDVTSVHSLPSFPPTMSSALVPGGSISPAIILSPLLALLRWLIMSAVHTHTNLLIKGSVGHILSVLF